MRLRPLVVAAAVTASLWLGAGSALAAGTGGIALSPAQSGGAGVVTAFHVALRAGQTTVEHFLLRNLTDRTAMVSLYAASASRGGSGAWSIGGPGSAPWIGIPTQPVRLRAHQSRWYSFRVTRAAAPRGRGLTYGAVVLSQGSGTVVERAATLVYLDRLGPSTLPRALLPIVFAVALVAAGFLLHARRRRPTAARLTSRSSRPSLGLSRS